MKTMQQIQRALDAQLPDPEPPEPPEVPDATPCPCGGYAVDDPAVGRWDTSAIICSRRPACARLVSYTVRTRERAVEAWNLEIEGERA